MLKSELIAKKISKKIKTWSKNQAKLVVAIDGYAGSSKTTVVDFIAKQNSDVLVLHIDDFIKHWRDRKKMIAKAKDKSKVFEYDWYRYRDLEKLASDFKIKKQGMIKFKIYDYDKNDFGSEKAFDLSRKVLVIDGIFLFHPKHKISKLSDKKIYFDADLKKADKKIMAREKKKWGKDYIPENHPDNWLKYFRIAYKRYVKEYKPKRRADCVFRV